MPRIDDLSLLSPTLEGAHVRLEPLGPHHEPGLVEACLADPSIYVWSANPRSEAEMARYVDTALSLRNQGLAAPFATVRRSDGKVLGSTRFFDFERWPWPEGAPRCGRETPDTCEIGYTWLTAPALRTAANTEAKLLMLTHAFDVWDVERVCLHTDARNDRSAAAMERMGAKFEGVLRAYRFAVDGTPRNSLRYSIVAAEWPAVKARLTGFLAERAA